MSVNSFSQRWQPMVSLGSSRPVLPSLIGVISPEFRQGSFSLNFIQSCQGLSPGLSVCKGLGYMSSAVCCGKASFKFNLGLLQEDIHHGGGTVSSCTR